MPKPYDECSYSGDFIGNGYRPGKSISEPALPPGYTILDWQTADVTGDRKPKDILLVGRKPAANSNFAGDLSIVIHDGPSQKVIVVKLPGVGGYNSKIFVGDFNGDKIDDVLVTIPSGGSGGCVEHRIVTFVGKPKIIFGEKENNGIKATGHFIDGFKAVLTEESTKRKAIVDLSNKKKFYIKAGLYNADGRLLHQQEVTVNPFGELDPIDVEPDGTYELRGLQRVIGIFNADTVANIYSIWKYENQQWAIKQIEIASLLLGYGEKTQNT